MPALQDIVGRLGSELISAPVASAGLGSSFQRIVIYDAREAPGFESGDLVLGVGVPAESALAIRIVEARPLALLLRHDGPISEALVSAAVACGVAILLAPAGCSWSVLHEAVLSLPATLPGSYTESLTGSEVVADLFAVANALADKLQAPITIEDNQSRLLAYSARHEGADEARSATILGHRVPDAFRREVRRLGIAKRLLSETEPFFIATTIPGIRSRTVVALRARDEVLGSIWAISDEPFDTERTTAFAEAAHAVAVRLLHYRLTADLKRQHDVAAMALLLRGGPVAVGAGERVGLSGDGFRLVAITAGPSSEGEDAALLDKCWAALSMQFALTGTKATAALVESTIYGVVPCPDDPRGLDETKKLLHSLRSSLDDSARTKLTMGISGPVHSLTELADARDEADRVVRALKSSPDRDTCASVEEVWMPVTLGRLADLEAARRFGPPSVLKTIDDYDASHSTNYGSTLRIFLSSFGNPSLASSTLGVHTNTLRYRLHRLCELFEVDLEDEDTRFALMMEARLSRL